MTPPNNGQDEITPYLPYLMKDLWELGSIPAYKYELLSKHMLTNGNPSIIDFGCGKGAELIQLAGKFKFTGTGVDILPEFIEEANFRKGLNLAEFLTFKVDDFKKNIASYSDFNVLIYDYDVDIFGNIPNTLNVLKNVILKDKGCILFDNAILKTEKPSERTKNYDNFKNVKTQIIEAGYDVLSYIFWDMRHIVRTDEFNNMCIARRAEELKEKYPDKQELLSSYVRKKSEKAELFASELNGITWLLRIKK